jgi:outer membrane protein TolC
VLIGALLTHSSALRGQANNTTPLPNTSTTIPETNPLPINLPTALQLAGVRPIDITVAAQRTQIAAAELQKANLYWLPTLYIGADYQRHDGQIQDVAGRVFTTSRSSVFVGAGPVLSFGVTDAIYGPLAARQVLQAARANEQTAANNNMLAVAENYFVVQQSRGELAGAQEALRRSEDLIRRIDQLAGDREVGGLIAPVESNRARTELARRRESVEFAQEYWQTASAEMARLLRLAPTDLVSPVEPPQLEVTLIDLNRSIDELVPIGLTNRPELAAQQALVQATLARLRQERIRPLVPSIILRPANTSPSNLLAGGVFGGGINDNVSNFGARGDFDAQLVWEFQNLGLGNRAQTNIRRGENQLAVLELFRIQDRVAAEVTQAHAQAIRSAQRVRHAEMGVREAVESANKNLAGVSQTRPVGGTMVLLIRPQEAVASVQALAQAYTDYYRAVADANRAQFRLYRALGQPAQCVSPTETTPLTHSPVSTSPPAAIAPVSHVEWKPVSTSQPAVPNP